MDGVKSLPNHTIYNINGCILKDYGKAFSVHNITKGFQVTRIRISLSNLQMFTDDTFLASYVTN